MDISNNPIHANGFRNIFCPFYSECLDHAAKNHWQAFHCSDCIHKDEIKPLDVMSVINDDYPYYQVSSDIYRKLN